MDGREFERMTQGLRSERREGEGWKRVSRKKKKFEVENRKHPS